MGWRERSLTWLSQGSSKVDKTPYYLMSWCGAPIRHLSVNVDGDAVLPRLAAMRRMSASESEQLLVVVEGVTYCTPDTGGGSAVVLRQATGADRTSDLLLRWSDL